MIRTPKRLQPRRGPAGVPPDEWRNSSYLQFLAEECRCIISGRYGCDPCHGPVNGRSSKGPDCEAVPMVRTLHEEQTRIGWPAFEAKYRIDRAELARAHWALFLIWRETLA